MTILIINNYLDKKNPRIDDLTNFVKAAWRNNIFILHYSEIKNKGMPQNPEAVILSGSEAHLSDANVFSNYKDEADLIARISSPLLGICFGHQLIAKVFGSTIERLNKLEKGFKDIVVVEPDDIFKSWKPDEVIHLQESHRDYVKNLLKEFILLAKSNENKIEAMKHEAKPIYGIQAHIERATQQHAEGTSIFKNFLSTVDEHARH